MENIAFVDPQLREDEVFVRVEVLASAFRALDEAKAGDKRDRRGKRGEAP